MATFTSTLPDDLLSTLSEKARKLSMPKNKLIENALRLYLEHLEKAEYIKSYKQSAADEEVLAIAEEGMQDYFRQLEKGIRAKYIGTTPAVCCPGIRYLATGTVLCRTRTLKFALT